MTTTSNYSFHLEAYHSSKTLKYETNHNTLLFIENIKNIQNIKSEKNPVLFHLLNCMLYELQPKMFDNKIWMIAIQIDATAC